MLTVKKLDFVGFDEVTDRGVIWLTGTDGLKVCIAAKLGELQMAVAAITANQTWDERQASLRIVEGVN